MNRTIPIPTRALPCAFAVMLTMSVASAFGQSTETVTLPEFTIKESTGNPYISKQALSGTRVAMDIQDIPQTVSIVTNAFMQDSLSGRMLEAAKYITPVVESTIPFNADRYMIRGFQVSHEFIDGAEISGFGGYSMSLAPYNIERIEIIKGPNAILVPGGSPGGQFNPITKSPVLKNFGEVTLELAQYFGTAASFDVNRILDANGKMAARVVGAQWYSDGYLKNQFRHGYLVAPSFSWQLSPTQKMVVRAEVVRNRDFSVGGVPIDPSVGSNDTARIATGLPRNWTFGNESDTKRRATERITAELFSTLNEHVTSRLQVMADHVIRDEEGSSGAAIGVLNAAGGVTSFNPSINPNTGFYEPGTVWSIDQTGPTAIVTSTPAPLPNPANYAYTRNTGTVYLTYSEAHFRNDYAMKFESKFWKSTTIAGIAANTVKVRFYAKPSAARPFVAGNNLAAITYPPFPNPPPSLPNNGNDRTNKQNDLQLYLYENASFFADRLQLSAGVSRFNGTVNRVDTTGIGVPLPPAVYYPSFNLQDTAHSYGVVVKPIPQVSVFYGYNTSGGQMPDSLSAGANIPSNLPNGYQATAGSQKEYGVKTSLFNNTLTASFSYFDIAQTNYSVPNSEYYTLIAQGVAVPSNFPTTLFLDLNSKGWEVEGSYAVNKNLMILGNYTRYKERVPITNIRVRAVPDESYGFYADYRFTDGPLTGFGINLGVDHKGDAAGDQATGYTTTKPLPGGKLVPNQPTFLVAERTLANLGFSYRMKTWTARVQINNVFDKDYIMGGNNRSGQIVGDPRSLKGSVTFKF